MDKFQNSSTHISIPGLECGVAVDGIEGMLEMACRRAFVQTGHIGHSFRGRRLSHDQLDDSTVFQHAFRVIIL